MPVSAPEEVSGSRRWVFTMTAAFLYAAAVLRTLLESHGGERVLLVVLLVVWLALLVTEPPLSRRWPAYFGLYLALQAVVIFTMLQQSDNSDYFAILFAVPIMSAMERWPARRLVLLVAASAVLTFLGILQEYGTAKALAVTVLFAPISLLLGSYTLTARRAAEARARNEALAADLREANQRQTESAAQAELLAAARERERLARDLHDSVTQTLFSMTLAVRSASLLLERQPDGLAAQLDQIERLGRSAKVELRALSDELPGPPLVEGGLAAGLRRLVAERAAQDGLTIHFRVEDDGRQLPMVTEDVLLHIVQEALNNVVKHAGVSQAELRLRLGRPAKVEVADRGLGFDRDAVSPSKWHGAGLGIMQERAAEIGWHVSIDSSPGLGTLVMAEEMSDGADGQSGAGGGDVE